MQWWRVAWREISRTFFLSSEYFCLLHFVNHPLVAFRRELVNILHSVTFHQSWHRLKVVYLFLESAQFLSSFWRGYKQKVVVLQFKRRAEERFPAVISISDWVLPYSVIWKWSNPLLAHDKISLDSLCATASLVVSLKNVFYIPLA